MKKLILLVSVWFLLLPVYGQVTILNSGFENWVQNGQSNEPEHWSTMNDLFVPGGQPIVNMTSDAFSGNTAISMSSATAGSFFINGQVSGYFGVTARPAALTGYYKYAPVGTDTFQVMVLLTKFNPLTLSDTLVGHGIFESGGNGNTYSFFSAPITYTSSDIPDTIRIYMVPGTKQQFPGSELRVDDLNAPLSISGLGNSDIKPQELQVYPNPGKGSFKVVLPENLTQPTYYFVTNAIGETVVNGTITNQNLTFDFSGLSPGMYRLHLSNSVKIYCTRIMIIN